MAIPVDINTLLNDTVVESTRIEFKKDYNPTTIIHSICAFANDIDNIGGGYIIIGVDEDNGSPIFPITGISKDRVDKMLKDLLQLCHYLEPLYEPVVEPVLYKDTYVIVMWIPGGHGRPYKAPKDATSRQSNKYYYIRKFSSSIIASPEEEKELFYISSNIPFDDRPNLLADVNDLDIGLMRNHLKEANSSLYELSSKKDIMDIAKDMQLLNGPPEALKPLNVAILMFTEHPEKYFRYARIEVVDIPDPTGNNMTEKVFTGPIQRQLKDALAYIKNYVIKEVVIKVQGKAEATRIFNYPYEAIEELLANAVYHRSYQINEPITVRITSEAIEITSYPGFDRSISDDAIKDYNIKARFYRNRRIGDFLKELHLIEGRNTGFPNAIAAIKKNESPMLTFEMDAERRYLAVTLPIHNYFVKKADSKQKNYEDKILSILSVKPHNLTELSTAMGYKGITAKLRTSIKLLKDSGKIIECLVDNKAKFKITE